MHAIFRLIGLLIKMTAGFYVLAFAMIILMAAMGGSAVNAI